MRVNEFLARHAVFTVDELERLLPERGSGNTHTAKSFPAYHRSGDSQIYFAYTMSMSPDGIVSLTRHRHADRVTGKMATIRLD